MMVVEKVFKEVLRDIGYQEREREREREREKERERERDLPFCIFAIKKHQVSYSKPVHTYAIDLSIELFLFQFGPVSSNITEIYIPNWQFFPIFTYKYEIFSCED